MGTASKRPTKKEVKVPPRRTSRCPLCNKLVGDLSKHIGTTDCQNSR